MFYRMYEGSPLAAAIEKLIPKDGEKFAELDAQLNAQIKVLNEKTLLGLNPAHFELGNVEP